MNLDEMKDLEKKLASGRFFTKQDLKDIAMGAVQRLIVELEEKEGIKHGGK